MAWRRDFAGIIEQGMGTSGDTRNLGGSAISVRNSRGKWIATGNKDPGPRRRVILRRERTNDAKTVPSNEGNEVRREGRQGVGATNSSGEGGEPYRVGPAGAKGLPDHGIVGGKDDREIKPYKRLNETTTNSRTGSANAG